MSTITIRKSDITGLDVDAVVNAANTGLWEGGGVCGAIFRRAGSEALTAACSKYGHCDVGSAVITPGFQLQAKYIIHAVGPQWIDGKHKEPQQLYGAYQASLALARENGCRSIGFPLISAGIFGYPHEGAWRKAIQACADFIRGNPDYDIDIVFAVLDEKLRYLGQKTLYAIYPPDDHAAAAPAADSASDAPAAPAAEPSAPVLRGISEETARKVIAFRDERNWKQFHTPKDLAISLCLEAGELLEVFQWSGADTQCAEKLDKIREELADVANYCVLMADCCGLSLDEIIQAKVQRNAEKYPVEKAYGRREKYNEL